MDDSVDQAPGLASEFGSFTSKARFDNLPSDVVTAVKLRVLDTFGAALAGYRLGTVQPLLPLIGDGGPATIWGSGIRVPPRDAALLNSFVSHACYMEDGSRYTGGHPSCVVIPPLIALSEIRSVTGRALITAVAVGYDVFLRLGRAVYPSIVQRGFQSTAVLGAVSAAAACASLLGLGTAAAAHAVAIGSTLGVGLKEALKSSAMQPLQVARSAEGGLIAALLAESGAEGADRVIEAGFLRGFADNVDLSGIVEDLGHDYRIAETYLKRHGGCRGNHAPIDVVEMLLKKNELTAEAIERIDVAVDTVTLAAEIAEPRNGEQAQFSIRFAVAANIVFGDASVHRYTDAALSDPSLRHVMDRIRVWRDPALDAGYPTKRAASAVVTLRDKTIFEATLDNARGEPEEPLTASEIESKFISLATPVIGVSRADEIISLIGNLEALGDARTLAAALVEGGC